MITIAICDDEKIFMEQIKDIIATYSIQKNLNIGVVEFSSGKELLESDKHYNILFLDIRLEDGTDGIEIGCKLREKGNTAIFILATLMNNRYKDGYKANVLRYIEKPFNKKEVLDVLDTALEVLDESPQKFEITFKQNKTIVNKRDIIYIESCNRKRYVHTTNGKFETLATISELSADLSQDNFYLIQKGFLINLKHVKKISKQNVVMADNRMVMILRGKYEEFNSLHMQYLKGAKI